MAAPTATARQAPSGLRLKDGFRALHTFAAAPTISLWEMEVTPPGVDGGEAINTTTMHNVEWRTFSPRALKTLSESTIKFAFDPALLTALIQQTNRVQAMTTLFSDGSTWAYFAFLRITAFDPMVEGTMPSGTMTITPSNTDDNDVEQAPVLVSVAGT